VTLLQRPFLTCLLFACIANLTSCINDPEPTHIKQLDIGEKTELGSLDVGPAGGKIEVTTGKLAGLTVIIPANAYSIQHTVRLYSSPITGNSFGEDINPRSPLITLDANGVFANANITILVPAVTSAGEFTMGFYYDKSSRELEGLPLASVSESFIAIVLRKPGDFFISSIPTAKLAGTHVSGFEPGIDDWDFINEGTARTPNGQVAGMTLSALWYYHAQTAKGQPHLWGRFNSEYDDPPSMWYDNVEGLQFATQTEIDFDWKNNWKDLTSYVNFDKNDLTRNAIAYSILITKRPQLVSISGDKGVNLPFIVYKKDVSDIFLSDPNFQAKKDRKMFLSGAKPGSYSTAFSTIAYQKQDFAFLRNCAYMGVSALVDFDKIGAIKQNVASTAPLPVNFKALSDEEIIIDGERIYTLGDSIRLTSTDNTAQLYSNNTLSPIGDEQTIHLKSDKTIIGIFLNSPGYYSGTSLWRAWKWYTVFHGASTILVPIKDTGNIGEILSFRVKTNLPSWSQLVYDWTAGDGRSFLRTTLDTFRVSYTSPGTFQVGLTAKNSLTDEVIASNIIDAVVLGPHLSILPIKDTGYIGSEIKFVAKVTNNPIEGAFFEWTAPEGQIIAGNIKDTFKVTYGQTGTYPVSVKMINLSNGKELGNATSIAHVIEPSLSITTVSEGLYVGNIITFKVNHQSNFVPLVYEWDAGDGTPIVTTEVNSKPLFYTLPAAYAVSVKIKVKSSGLVVGQAATSVNIGEFPYVVSPTNISISLSESIIFGTLPRHRQGYSLRYIWDFGDGSSTVTFIDSNIAAHQYNTAGSYKINLTVLENTSGIVQGRAETNIKVIDAVVPPTLSHVHQMKFVKINFGGCHIYNGIWTRPNIFISNQPDDPPYAPDVPITWNNTSYSGTYDQGLNDPSYEFDTMRFFGEVSSNLKSFKSLQSFRHHKKTKIENFNGEIDDERWEDLTLLQINDIPLIEVTVDSIRFRLNGILVQQMLEKVVDSHSYFRKHFDRHGINSNSTSVSTYTNTDWYSSAFPYIEIVIYK
jgi:PKD repeat protein